MYYTRPLHYNDVHLFGERFVIRFCKTSKILLLLITVVGAILVCCYPLWPEWMRIVVYYLSLAGAGFLGVIIALAISKYPTMC